MKFTQFFQRFHPLNKLEQQRQNLDSSTLPIPLQALFAQPYPKPETDLTALSYLVIDFETTGLNSMIDNILSVAAIPIEHFTLDLSLAWHDYVAEQQVNEETVVINHIVPQMLNGAQSLDQVMNKLFSLMQGRIVIAHGANIEKRFIQHYLATRYQITEFPIIWLDTLKIERSFVNEKRGELQPNYQLSYLRQHYHLPEYVTHNAMIDAIAAGELFLAQMVKLYGREKMPLGEVYRRSL